MYRDSPRHQHLWCFHCCSYHIFLLAHADSLKMSLALLSIVLHVIIPDVIGTSKARGLVYCWFTLILSFLQLLKIQSKSSLSSHCMDILYSYILPSELLTIQVSVWIYHQLLGVVELTIILKRCLRGHSVPLPPTTAPWEHLLVLQPGLVTMENGLGLHHRAKTLVC